MKLNGLQSLLVSTPGRDSWCDLGTITRNKAETKEAGTGAQQCQIDVESHMAPCKNKTGQGQEELRNCLDNPGKIQAVKVPHYFKVKGGIFCFK